MSAYPSILGHDRQIEGLERARHSGRVAHAYLFQGPDGIGKERVAFAFARALNCTDEARAPCGECASCRKVEKGSHPDVRLVASEDELVSRGILEMEKGHAPSVWIKNAQIDELAGLFRHRPYLGRWKVVVIANADGMNENSQNRFLKTLEEPSQESVIILVTARPQALLPTVRSRCQVVAFAAAPRLLVARFLESQHGLEPDRARVLAAMAQGSFRRAAELVQGEILEARDSLAGMLEHVLDGDLEQLLAMSEEEGRNRDQVEATLELMELWFRDLLMARLGVSEALWVNLDRGELVRRQADRADGRRWLAWIDRVRKVRRSLRVNANPRMVMESLLLSMRSR